MSRDWNDAATSQAMPRIVGSMKAGDRHETLSLKSLPVGAALLGFQAPAHGTER